MEWRERVKIEELDLKKKMMATVHTVAHQEKDTLCTIDEATVISNSLRYNGSPAPKFGCNIVNHIFKRQICNPAEMLRWVAEKNRSRRRAETEKVSKLLFSTDIHNTMMQGSENDRARLSQKLEHLDEFGQLLSKITVNSQNDQITAARTLRQRTSEVYDFTYFYCKIPSSIPSLLRPLSRGNAAVPELQQEVVSIVLHLSKDNDYREVALNSYHVVSALVQYLRFGHNPVTKGIAAQALCELAKGGDSARDVIGRSGAIESLLNQLHQNDVFLKKDSCATIIELCCLSVNQEKVHSNLDLDNADEFLSVLRQLAEEGTVTLKDMQNKGAISILDELRRYLDNSPIMRKCLSLFYDICNA